MAPVRAGAQTPPPPGPFLTGQAAVDALDSAAPPAPAIDTGDPADLRQLFLDDPALALSPDGRLAYFDSPAGNQPQPQPALSLATGASAIAPALPAEAELASLPGADKTIYLDFDGHVTTGTSWNSTYNLPAIDSPPFDLDGDPTTFDSYESSVILQEWRRVAEDFVPFNVNVTTIDPGVEALQHAGPGDSQWGIRVVITPNTFSGCGCTGMSFLNSFQAATDEPAFVFTDWTAGGAQRISESVSHEAGHALGLANDGTLSGVDRLRLLGGGRPDMPAWGPIMGFGGTYSDFGQWSQQEYFDANNNDASANFGQGPDDIAIIASLTNGNGFGLRPDDHGDTPATATPISAGAVSASGIIGSRDDIDAFTFTTSGGPLTLTAHPSPDDDTTLDTWGNLDIALTLRAADGSVLATDSPSQWLRASVSVAVPAGTYTIEIDGVGVGDPSANPPYGWTDYASLGRYTLTGTIEGATIRAAVVDTNGQPLPGISAGLFQASGSDRGPWVADAGTGPDGTLAFTGQAPGCYIITFVAELGQVFQNERRFLNSEPTCVVVGDDVTVAPAVVSNDTNAIVQGTVRTSYGQGREDVSLGLFQATNGTRGPWVRDTTTGPDGTYNLDGVVPGCYLITFVAPEGWLFTNASHYLSTDVFCVVNGDRPSGVDGTLFLDGDPPAINGLVDTLAGATVPDLSIGLFHANGDGSRGPWVLDTRTDAAGAFAFSYLQPGCYLLTFVAPAGELFTNSSQYLTSDELCVDGTVPGPLSANATLIADGTTATVGGTVHTGVGAGLGGVSLGLFQANADGDRGRWLRDTTTAVDGSYRFGTVVGGCYVITFVAPTGLGFAPDGSPYFSTGVVCVESGDAVTGLDAAPLSPT